MAPFFGEPNVGAHLREQGLQIPPAHPGHYDETRRSTAAKPLGSATTTALSRAWTVFFTHLNRADKAAPNTATAPALSAAFEALERQIQDDGATYNVHAEAGQSQRPWPLDLFPLILDAPDWQHISQGVLQRVRLLNAIAGDVYGAQTVLQQGLLPAALVRGHPGYLRALQGATVADGTWLRIAAFDLVRAPDGQWRLIAQRTQAPSGLGYALENRLAISSQFPQAFQALGVQRLAAAYTALLQALQTQSPADGSPAHIALLTPGPYSETYFEQAYLARYLGISLVQGNDLTVRNERLYLKTIQGLRPVHGLIKRLDDDFLDPLELRADSALGVPGLLQAIRAGHVLMANMPGTGFLESPALLGFLPALSERLLGESLHLPGLPTWWCGEKPALDEAARQFGTLVVKPTVRGSSLHQEFESVFTERLHPAERQHWLAKINAAPTAHTIQQWAPQSQMPSWQPGRTPDSGSLRMKSVVLRVFALQNGPQSWCVLPGGMARLADTGMPSAAMRHGASSADVWIRTADPVDHSTRLPTAGHLPPSTRNTVTSRAAENLFWLGRYTERAEHSVRLAHLLLHLLGSEALPSPELAQWLLEIGRQHGLLPADAADIDLAHPLATTLQTLEQQLLQQLCDTSSLSVGFNLRGMRSAAQAVRERLSSEQWQLIASAPERLHGALPTALHGNQALRHQALHALRNASVQLSSITGCQTDRMTRDSGWRLLYIGRLIERLHCLSHTLHQALHWQVLHELTGFEATLALFDSTITFHARHQQQRHLLTLCDLLITDRENPRALAWVTQSMRSHLDKLTVQQGRGLPSLSALLPDPRDWQPEALCTGNPPPLAALLQELQQSAHQLSDAISARSFAFSDAAPTSVMR